MIKKLFLVVTLFLTSNLSMFGQVQIGIDINTEQKIPFHAAFGFSYSQSIYLASEINATGTITSIQWYYTGSGTLSNSQNLTIYIGNTSKATFTSTTDWAEASSLTQVYNGGINTNETPGWKIITLSTPFVYDGTSNLIVAVDENQEQWDNYDDQFYNSSVNGTRSIYYFNDSNNPNPNNPPEAGDIISFVPNIILGGITQACPTPYYLNVTNITTTTATVTWQPSPVIPANGSSYFISTTDSNPTNSTIPTGTIATGELINLSNLIPETSYYIWIKNNCETGLSSSWSSTYSFKTDCEAITDFYENFDGVVTPNLPSCWSKILRGGESLSPYASIESSNWQSQSEPNSIRMDSDQSDVTTADIILVSPHLSTLSLGTYRLKFYAKGNGILQVGTLNTNDANATFTENSLGNINTTSTLTQYVIDFANYTGTDKYIGIRLATESSNVYIDNVLWEISPLCPDVTEINVPLVTTSTATIEWLSGNPTASVSWEVVIGSETEENPSSLSIIPSSITTKQVTGLVENTNYKVWVRTACSTENGAWIGPVVFRTACLGIASFNENFNQTESPNLPNCWTSIARGESLSEYYMIETNQYSDLFDDENNAVQLFNENSGNDADMILVSPNLSTLSLGTYRLKFYAKSGFTPASVDIVTLDSNTNSAESSLYETIALTENTNQYVVEFSNYIGTDMYIGFRLNATETYSSIYLDNILWELNPSCPDVTEITIPETTANTATISWMGSGAESTWDVAVSATPQDPNALTFTNFNTNSAVVSNLIDNTDYLVWVRSVCVNNDKGVWIGPISFKTSCLPAVTITENFESVTTPSLPACWSSIIRGASVPDYAYIKTSPWSNMPEPTTAVLLNTSSATATDDIILVSPAVNTLSLGSYRLKFKAKGASTLQIGTLNSNTNSAVFTNLQTVTVTDIPTVYEVHFSNYIGTDTYIGIRVNTEVDYQYVEVDNIIWQPIPLCPDTNNLHKTGTTITSASFAWNATISNQYQIAIGDLDTLNPENLMPISLTNTNHTFENLTAGTSYKVWVRSTCGTATGNGEWSEPITVTTQCIGVGVPYTEDFETASESNLPNCSSSMNLAEAPSTWYTSYYPGYGFESRTLTYEGDLFTDANSWFFTRGIHLVAGQSYTVSYRYGGASTDTFYYNNNLVVKYGTQASAENMTLAVAEHLDFAVDTPVLNSVTITVLTTGIYYFGFNVTSLNNSYFMYLDDIQIDSALSNYDLEKNQLSYYPNPVKSVLNIGYTESIDNVEIYNMLGQEVFRTIGSDKSMQLDMSSFASGTYIVKVSSGQSVKIIKVIKS